MYGMKKTVKEITHQKIIPQRHQSLSAKASLDRKSNL